MVGGGGGVVLVSSLRLGFWNVGIEDRFTDDAAGRVSGIEAVFLYRTSWERSVEDAKHRNANS